jgi:hypothetical protein
MHDVYNPPISPTRPLQVTTIRPGALMAMLPIPAVFVSAAFHAGGWPVGKDIVWALLSISPTPF